MRTEARRRCELDQRTAQADAASASASLLIAAARDTRAKEKIMSLAEGSVVKGSGAEVYVVLGGQRRWIVSEQALNASYGGWAAVRNVADAELNALPLGAPVGTIPDGTLFKGSGPEVYVIQGGQRRHVPNPQVLETLGGWAKVSLILDGNLNAIPKGAPLPTQGPVSIGPVEVSKQEEVGSNKTMRTRAVLYRNGHMDIDVYTESRHLTEGLRGHLYITCIDDQGRAHWVTDEFVCTTRGSVPDLFTPSKGTNAFSVNLPEPVGRLTARLEIHHSTGPLGDALAGVKNFIAGTKDVYDEIKPFLEKLTMAMA
ncbi:hypothetical protein E2C05_21280 [Paracraurococcus ruber]|nr:hypothetical protein E2C05_21280 [Paracraurococcus ruber]